MEVRAATPTFSTCSNDAQLRASEEFLEIEDFNILDAQGLSLDDCNDLENKAHGVSVVSELDDFFDASMFLDGSMPPLDTSATSYFFNDGIDDDEIQHLAYQVGNELWTHEAAVNGTFAMDLNRVAFVSPAAGAQTFWASNDP